MISQIVFILLSITAIYLVVKKALAIRRRILLGRGEKITADKGERWRNVFLMALGQKKMFKKPLVGILHFFVYAGFIIINIELIEIVIDGVWGTHRVLAGFETFYHTLINIFEILALSVILSCAIFFIRRNVVKIKRLTMPELDGWPKSDANIILITEILLMSAFLCMNACDTLIQTRGISHYAEANTGNFIISQWMQSLFNGLPTQSLIFIERFCWWFHITGIYAFAVYLAWSKHLHIVLAFPNIYYASLLPQAEMQNMPEIQNEVLYAMQPEKIPTEAAPDTPAAFGAKDIFDLSWKNIMDAYTCTECGRCTAVCPPNITGKKLSPRRIMMQTRDRTEEVAKNIQINKTFKADEKTLLHEYITQEELVACTTCSACVEACPVGISPLSIIYQLRRFLLMEESKMPAEWNSMNANIENNFAPWQFSPDDRENWRNY